MGTTTSLFTNQTSNANSPTQTLPGVCASLLVKGTWGGATVKLQVSHDGGSTYTNFQQYNSATGTYQDIALTSDGAHLLTLPVGLPWRLVLSGATGTTNINASYYI